jgi:glycosyltransferase involved in cell wall biosynthesis
MKLLIMLWNYNVVPETKPEFYIECGKKVFHKYGIETSFLPDLRKQMVYRLLNAFKLNRHLCETLSANWWLIKNRKKYDVILGLHNADIYSVLKYIIKWRKPKLCMVLYRLYDPNSSPIKLFVKKTIVMLISRGCDLLLAVDKGQADYYHMILKRKAGTTDNFTYGVDYEWFKEYRNAINHNTNSGYIFYPGSADRDDDTLCNAIRELELVVKRYQIGAVGATDEAKSVGSSRIENKYNKNYKEYVRDCLESKVVVISVKSSDKPVGLTSLLECMALGKPVIITKGLSSNDYVKNGVTAIEYETGDSKKLKEGILKIFNDESYTKYLVNNAYKALENKFDLYKCGEELASKLNSLEGSDVHN